MSEGEQKLGFGMAVGPEGRFVLQDKLGEGGMGEVWLAQDGGLEVESRSQLYALKFLSRAVRDDPQAMSQLKSEVLRSQELIHPNIVRVFDLHFHHGLPFIKMEYVEGSSLRHWLDLEPSGCMDAYQTLKLALPLAEALKHAHQTKRIVHRDLKPANLLLNSAGELKLSDFGLSVRLDDASQRVSDGGPSGTPPYASPQQLAGADPSPADDVYAFGATLYELLTGSVPFMADSWDELIRRVNTEPPQPIPERLAALGRQNDVPPRLLTLIYACLAKDPLNRPKFNDIIHRLQVLIYDYKSQSAPPAPPPPRFAFRRWVTAAVLTALLGLAWMQKAQIQQFILQLRPQPRPQPEGTNTLARSPTPETNTDPKEIRDPPPAPLPGTVSIRLEPGKQTTPPYQVSIQTLGESTATNTVRTLDPTKPPIQISLAPARYLAVITDSSTNSGEHHPWELHETFSITSATNTPLNIKLAAGDLEVEIPEPHAKIWWPEGTAADPKSTNSSERTGDWWTPTRFRRAFRPGWIRFQARPPGYLLSETNVFFRPGITTDLVMELRPNKAPRRGSGPWTNSLGLVFVWVPEARFWAATTETRVRDFRNFAKDPSSRYEAKTAMYAFNLEGRTNPPAGYSWERPGPGFEQQTDDHPVVGVSWDDADSFCGWLTQHEQFPGQYLEDTMKYRLPSTNEWSCIAKFAGAQKFPWGSSADVIPSNFNYAGTEVANSLWPRAWPFLANHTDEFPRTAPAADSRFSNDHGFFHVGGNAAEWCGGNRDEAVLCGGSWFDGEWEPGFTNSLDNLMTTACRQPGNPAERDARNGFRVVIFDSAR